MDRDDAPDYVTAHLAIDAREGSGTRAPTEKEAEFLNGKLAGIELALFVLDRSGPLGAYGYLQTRAVDIRAAIARLKPAEVPTP